MTQNFVRFMEQKALKTVVQYNETWQYGTDLKISESRKVPNGTLSRVDKQANGLYITRHRQCCVSGSGFNGVPGSGSVFAIRIRIQEGKTGRLGISKLQFLKKKISSWIFFLQFLVIKTAGHMKDFLWRDERILLAKATNKPGAKYSTVSPNNSGKK